jgi:monovalent cation:proton antiporter-2 (CPA2) family protein
MNAAATVPGAFLRDGAILLGAALVFVTLFRRLGLGATLGYIVAGALIGPSVLGFFREPEAIQNVSEIGIALLLFIVGLELQPSRLWHLRKDIFGLGLLQVTLCGFAIAAILYFGPGFSPEASLAIGLPLALSSTAQVLPMLRADNELNTPQGERAFSILLFQDLSIVPLITIIAAMSRVPADPSTPTGWKMAAYTLVAIIGLVAFGRLILNPFLRLIGRLGERELFVVIGLFTVIGSAAVMHQFGLSTALGAFVAGVVLAESPYRHELDSDLEPFRSILLGLFFLSVGMLLDLRLIAARPALVISIAAGVILAKTILISLLSRLFGCKWQVSIRLGLLLSQAGEFGFVLFGLAAAAQLISPAAASLFGAVVTLSMATTPFLMRFIDRMEARDAQRGKGLDGPELSPDTPVIIVGYGRFGQTVGQMLMAKRVPVTLVDTDAEMIEAAGSFGTKVYFGDGTRIDLLRTAGADQARAILFCNDNVSGALTREAISRVLDAFPHARVMVRTFDRRHMIELDGLDLAYTQRELFESAVKMGRAALKEAGVEPREIDRVEREYRLRDCERLERQTETGDIRAGQERSFGPDRALPEEEAEVPG